MPVSSAKTTEPMEMPFWAKKHAFDRSLDSKQKGQFLGLFGLFKSTVSHCCGIHSKKINNGLSATAAANCIAPDWPVSH